MDYEGNAFFAQNEILKNITGLKEDIFEEHVGNIVEKLENMNANNGAYRPIRTKCKSYL
ncbi:MAG: hypothetical protein HFJ50_08090 [Clostridia bacterium]|jgi:hypothetical protein|nr:hypothetical protein [Clostridia bacterium]